MRRARPVAYDIWFNRSATVAGRPDCAELMVWLNHYGRVQPFGSLVASGVMVGFSSTFAGDDTSPAGVWCG